MPYIKEKPRKYFNDRILSMQIDTKGELEYLIFKLLRLFMANKEYNYSNLHDGIYAVYHAADEFKRRFLDPREDKALEENGDIL